MSVATIHRPTTDTSLNSAKPPTVLHLMHQDDILYSQVYGVPSVAVCGVEFVPPSGLATSSAGESINCESCDILAKCGVHHPRKRY